MSSESGTHDERGVRKVPTGIDGLDEITGGGLPAGRSTLVSGGPGCGKTLLGVEFLVRGALDYGEPGVMLVFEETAKDIEQNVHALGFDVASLQAQNKLIIDYVRVERNEIEESGEYDLEGLFVRLGYAIDTIGAKRVLIDTIEVLFAGLSNAAILRSELRRLFSWLKTKNVTAIITAERGDGSLTRHGLEEYVSDCVILLDHRVHDQLTTRRLRIVKYRGSSHGTNEYPFLISDEGLAVLPITGLGLDHPVTTQRISSGIAQLDAMLGGEGYYRQSAILISGTAGAGKTSLAAHFVNAACARGERSLYLALEESAPQIVRNMRSIGLDLEQWQKADVLRFHAVRSTAYGLETHLTVIHRLLREWQPAVVVMDPISNLVDIGSEYEAKAALTRLLDMFKDAGVTSFFTSLTQDPGPAEQTEIGISSIMDSWLLVRNIEANGERNRGLYVLKSRGMAHSNQIREFILTSHGAQLVDVYLGEEGVLTGSARAARVGREQLDAQARDQQMARQHREMARKRAVLEAQITALRAQLEELDADVQLASAQELARVAAFLERRTALEKSREGAPITKRSSLAAHSQGNGKGARDKR